LICLNWHSSGNQKENHINTLGVVKQMHYLMIFFNQKVLYISVVAVNFSIIANMHKLVDMMKFTALATLFIRKSLHCTCINMMSSKVYKVM